MMARRSKLTSGTTLLEVLMAVVLTAVAALGLIAAQLWIMRDARATALREHAALFADAIVESTLGPATNNAALAQWKARAASVLPHGEALAVESGAGASVARVTWVGPANGSASGELIDMPVPCGEIAVREGASCIALAFAK